MRTFQRRRRRWAGSALLLLLLPSSKIFLFELRNIQYIAMTLADIVIFSACAIGTIVRASEGTNVKSCDGEQ